MWITYVEYHVFFNGDRIGPITPERGIQQGCPLSPYLYILCVKGTCALIKHHEFTWKFMVFVFVDKHLLSVTFFLHMTTFSSVNPLQQKKIISKIFSWAMKLRLIKPWILASQSWLLVRIHLMRWPLLSLDWWVSQNSFATVNILVSLRWLVEIRKQYLTTSKIESGKNNNLGALNLFHKQV